MKGSSPPPPGQENSRKIPANAGICMRGRGAGKLQENSWKSRNFHAMFGTGKFQENSWKSRKFPAIVPHTRRLQGNPWNFLEFACHL